MKTQNEKHLNKALEFAKERFSFWVRQSIDGSLTSEQHAQALAFCKEWSNQIASIMTRIVDLKIQNQ